MSFIFGRFCADLFAANGISDVFLTGAVLLIYDRAIRCGCRDKIDRGVLMET
jgi:hypothetical protein